MNVIIKKKYINAGGIRGYFPQFYCPSCKKQLGWIAEEKKIPECPMCKAKLEWE